MTTATARQAAPRSTRRRRATSRWLVPTAVLASSPAFAVQIPLNEPDMTLRWDNTVKYSNGIRLDKADPALAGTSPGYVNNGDRNFDRGSLISNRFDLLSELDFTYKRFGARISAAGWYDRAYLGHNDNPGPQPAFPLGMDYNEFPESVKNLHGRRAEVLDAFVYGSADLARDVSASFRLGRHSFQWGESTFLGANGIAGTMAPIDIIKALSVPGTQFKDLLMKVPQLSGTVSAGANLSFAGYYQFGWRPSRLPADGSYFSANDYRGPGLSPLEPHNKGQGGLMARYVPVAGEVEFGVYYTRFHSKTPDGVYLDLLNPGPPPAIVPVGYYHTGASAYGTSVSLTSGDFNIGAEASLRRNVALPSVPGMPTPPGVYGNDASSAGYAVGRTGHAQASVSWSVPRTALFDEALVLAEVAWNRRLSVQKNPGAVDPETDRNQVAYQFAFTPTFRQVTSGLDLGLPITAGYTHGKSGALGPALGPDGGGVISIGVSGTYLSAYNFGITYNTFYGPTGLGLYDQNLRDRKFLSLFVSTTF